MDDLVKYRMETSAEKLVSAKLLLDAGQYKDSIGRSYYAIFSAVRAILATRNVDFAKHAGVISYFQREYIKTGLFALKYSQYLQTAFQIRNNCDYNDFYIVAKADAQTQYEHAVEFHDAVASFLEDCNP